jgi:hypothetical protein
MKRVYKRSLDQEKNLGRRIKKNNQNKNQDKLHCYNISVTIVRSNSDDRNQDEADRLRSQRTTATMVAIVSEEADRSHPVALVAIDSIQPVSIDQGRSIYTQCSHRSPTNIWSACTQCILRPIDRIFGPPAPRAVCDRSIKGPICLHPVHSSIAHEESVRLHPVHYATDRKKPIRLHPVHPVIAHEETSSRS